MNPWRELLEAVRDHPYTPGLLGSLISLRWAGSGLLVKVFSFLCGTAAWAYAAPPLADYLGLKTAGMPQLMSLMCGMFGMKIAARLADAVHTATFEDIMDAVGKFFTKFGRK